MCGSSRRWAASARSSCGQVADSRVPKSLMPLPSAVMELRPIGPLLP
jgi:hypothetical protein